MLRLLRYCAMLGLVVVTRRSFPAELGTVPDPAAASNETEEPARWSGLLRNRMVALILAYQVLSAAVTQLLDFMVWERAAARFPSPLIRAPYNPRAADEAYDAFADTCARVTPDTLPALSTIACAQPCRSLSLTCVGFFFTGVVCQNAMVCAMESKVPSH